MVPDDLESVRPDPEAFADIEMSAGATATAWLDAAADVCAWMPDALRPAVRILPVLVTCTAAT